MHNALPRPPSTFAFLLAKIRGSLGKYLRAELESLAQWPFSHAPGLLGIALRNLVLKFILKAHGGFCWIRSGVTIEHAYNLRIGKHVGISPGTYINAIGGVTFGDYVLIGTNVTISSGVHPTRGSLPPIFCRPTEPKPISIETDVWLGAGAVIVPGVTLRRGTVVGANAVVTRDTEAYDIVAGAPARPIGSRSPQHGRQAMPTMATPMRERASS